jgi:uncharacterized damage-inducible protein DinB
MLPRVYVGAVPLKSDRELIGLGVTASASAWECLLHVVTHAHFHRGQLASQCRILGVCPPERHLMGHFIGLF